MENYVFNDRTFLWKINDLEEKAHQVFLRSAVLEIVLPSTVIVQSYLGEAKSLIELPDGARLEILDVETGRQDVYEHGIPIFSFEECHVEEVTIPEPVTIGATETRPLFVNIIITCIVEINWDNLNDTS